MLIVTALALLTGWSLAMLEVFALGSFRHAPLLIGLMLLWAAALRFLTRSETPR